MTKEEHIENLETIGCDGWTVSTEAYKSLQWAIEVLEQEPKWILVSERLPEDSGEYLVSVIDEYDENYEAVGVAWFAHKNDYDITESEWRELQIDETVIAWMPLPNPMSHRKVRNKE